MESGIYLRRGDFAARVRFIVAAASCAVCFLAAARADAPGESVSLEPRLAAEIDANVREVMEQTGVPGVSIAVVRDGKIVYEHAYGHARLLPEEVMATPETRYGIGSVSKQFTAAAILLLAQDGKLSLDDPVGRYIPGLTDGDAVTIRQVLSHTSGYQDYWPQDYVFPGMLKPVTADAILDHWAKIPLDFKPGTDWQYSNTNYTLAGRIVEKVSGVSLMDFLQKRIFEPLHMTGVDEDDTKPLGAQDAAGYTRVAMGPMRPAPQCGAGWLFAMGQLAMTPRNLALWDISMMDRSLLSGKSYDEMTAPVFLKSGINSQYGLGVQVSGFGTQRMIWHDGEISGFLTGNRVWPALRIAVVVIVNADGALVQSTIADRIAKIMLPPQPVAKNPPPAAGATPVAEVPPVPPLTGVDADARAIFISLQQGKVDASKLSENAKSYFTPQGLKDAVAGLKPLGSLRNFTPTGEESRGGMVCHFYFAQCEHGGMLVITYTLNDGRFEQFLVLPDLR